MSENVLRARVGKLDMLRVEGAALKAGVSISEWVRRKALTPDVAPLLQKRIDAMAEASGQPAARILETIVSDFFARADAEKEVFGESQRHALDLICEGTSDEVTQARFDMQKAAYVKRLRLDGLSQ